MVKRIRVINETKGQSKLLAPNVTTYGADMGDGSYTFELVSDVQGPFPVSGVDPAPINLTLPSAVGEATEGKTVNGIPGTWEGASALTAQWMDGGDPIGPEGYDLAVVRSLGGKSPRLRETAVNTKGPTVVYSDPIGPITTAPQFTTQPALAGTPTAGQTMTATAGAASGYPAPQVTGRIERQLGTTGDWMTVEGGLSAVFASGYRYRVASFATNSVNTVEAFTTPTAVVAATAAPLAAGANLPKQTIIQNTGTTVIAADSLFTGKVDTYALISPPAAFTINATTGAISVNTASLALRTDETITVRASNDTPATLDRTFNFEVVNASGTATVPGGVSLGTVTIATGPQSGQIVVSNNTLPPNGGSPLTGMRLRVTLMPENKIQNFDYPATLGNHTIGGLPPGNHVAIVFGLNAIGEGRPFSSPINITVSAPLSPPVGFSYEVTPNPVIQGKQGVLDLNATGKLPMTYNITVAGQNYSNTTSEFDASVFPAGAQTFTGTITNADGSLNISGGFTVAPYVLPTITATLSPAAPQPGDNVTISVNATAGAEVRVSYVKDGGEEVVLSAPYAISGIQNGRYVVSASATDEFDGTGDTSISFNVGIGVDEFQDDFSGAAGQQLASRPGWEHVSGPTTAFVTDGNGNLNMVGSTGSSLLLMPKLAYDNQQVYANMYRPPSGGGAQAAFFFGYQDANNFLRVLVDQANVSVARVLNGVQTTIASYGAIFSGTANSTVRFLAVDYVADKFQLSINGNRATPTSGSEVLSPALGGFRSGAWTYGGGGGRTPFLTSIGTKKSVVYAEAVEPGQPEPEPNPTPDNFTHSEADAYAISAPGTGSMRIRNYGATTGGTVTSGTGTIAGTLPGPGAFDVALDTGSGYGAPVTIWAIKVPGGAWYGRDAMSVQIAPKSGGTQVEVQRIPGKDVILHEAFPKMKQLPISTYGSFWINGIMKNKEVKAPLGLPGHAWDERRFHSNNTGYKNVSKIEGFVLSQAHTTWPDRAKVGDVYAKVVSIENLEVADQNERNGVISNQMGLIVVDALTPSTKLAGRLFKGKNISQAAVDLPGYASLLSRIQAMNYPCNCPQASFDVIYARLMRGNWNYALMRGGVYWKDSQEPYTPRQHTFPNSSSNYYGYDLYTLSMILLMSGIPTPAQKKDMLDALIFTGHHSDTPGFTSQLSAGMGQFHEGVVSLKRLAEGRRYEDMTLPPEQNGQYGAWFGSYFKWTAAMLPMLEPHNSIVWPGFSRWRNIVRIEAAAAGKSHFMMEINRSVGKGTGDMDGKQRYAGLEVVRENGEFLPFDTTSGLDADSTGGRVVTINGKLTVKKGVLGTWKTPLQVGEKIHFRIPPQFKPFVGMADWMYDSANVYINSEVVSWAGYNPSPQQSYRDQARAAGWVLLMTALGELDKTGPYRAVREYNIRTAYTDAPNNGWLNAYPGPHTPSVSWVSQFWSANRAALGLEMKDL